MVAKKFEALKFSSSACKPKGFRSSGATQAVPYCTYTTPSTNKTPSNTCWFATNRQRCMLQTDTHVLRGKSGLPW